MVYGKEDYVMSRNVNVASTEKVLFAFPSEYYPGTFLKIMKDGKTLIAVGTMKIVVFDLATSKEVCRQSTQMFEEFNDEEPKFK